MFQFDNRNTILLKENRKAGVLSHSIIYFFRRKGSVEHKQLSKDYQTNIYWKPSVNLTKQVI